MINWFNMPEEGLSNGGQFEIKELTATENGEYKKDGEVYNKVTVNVSGGASDFTTAEVEFTVTGGEAAQIAFVCIDNNSVVTDGAVVTGTFTLPLYKGHLNMSLLQQATVTITGSATYNEDDGVIIITGNCAITLAIG